MTDADHPAQRADVSPAAAPVRARVLAGCLAALSLAVLTTGAILVPAPEGHGTHRQLGLLACAWPQTMGIPCPTCGMTTAVSHAARGNFGKAIAAQPFGAVVALACATTAWLGGWVAATGSRVYLLFAGLLRPRSVWAAVGLLTAAWGYKIATWPA
ncbi:MAG: DUF2752 domain-containing protein [Phycisphaerales bacterium]|nr:DUF2752 domain-containing protein [Phycisphaerales bacterium]